MAKITTKSSLNVGTELTINTTTKTIKLNVAGNLVAKDGVSLQVLYSKLIDLWTTSDYNDFPFPMYAIDALSGQFQFGTDGRKYNGWKPYDDATRTYLRDGGWSEYAANGDLQRQYVGIVSLGLVSEGAQLYYQSASGDAPTNFTFTDEVNQGIQVFGDTLNGDFNKRDYFKGFVREYGKKYKDSVLADTGKSTTGAYIVNLLLSNEDDLKILTTDENVAANTPYTGIDVSYYGTDQSKTIGSGSYPFRVVIDGNNASLEQIYTKVQYLLRQATDIDQNAGGVVGKTASSLCYFVGNTLYTTTGVFIANLLDADTNRVVFIDKNGYERIYPYSAAGTLNFNDALVGEGSYYYMYFTTLPGDANYGTANAAVVNDASETPITGTIATASKSFTFDYTNNTQGGRTPAEDAEITLVAGRPGYAKPVVATGTLTQSKTISISVVAESDRAYSA